MSQLLPTARAKQPDGTIAYVALSECGRAVLVKHGEREPFGVPIARLTALLLLAIPNGRSRRTRFQLVDDSAVALWVCVDCESVHVQRNDESEFAIPVSLISGLAAYSVQWHRSRTGPPQ